MEEILAYNEKNGTITPIPDGMQEKKEATDMSKLLIKEDE